MRKAKRLFMLIPFCLILIGVFFLSGCGKKSSKNDKVQLGMSKSEVVEILGNPSSKDSDKYYWFGKAEKKLKQAEEYIEKAFEEDDESYLYKAEKVYNEVEKMTFEYKICVFSNDELIRFFYDTNHKYDEFDDYKSAEKKSVKGIEFEENSIITFYEDLRNANNSVVATNAGKIGYSATFTDKSIYKAYLDVSGSTCQASGDRINIKWTASGFEFEDSLFGKSIGKINAGGYVEEWEGDLKTLPSNIQGIYYNLLAGKISNMSDSSFTLSDNGYYYGIGDNPYYAFVKVADKNITDSFTVNKNTVVTMDDAFTGYKVNTLYIPGDVAPYGSDVIEVKNLVITSGYITQRSLEIAQSSIETLVVENGVKAPVSGYVSANCPKLRHIEATGEVLSALGVGIKGNITSCVIDGSTISGGALRDCSKLTNVTIKGNVTTIKKDAFSGCISLMSIRIPGSVMTIEDGAFNNCNRLVEVYNLSFVYNIKSKGLANKVVVHTSSSDQSIITVDDGYVFANYNSKWHLINYVGGEEDLVLPTSFNYEGTTITSYEIGEYFAYGKNEIKSVIIPSCISIIEKYAFSGCTNMESITIPSGVTKIENNVFEDCYALETIALPNSITEIGEWAFVSTGLKNIVLPNITKISTGLFCNSAIENVVIPNSVTSIERSAFNACIHLYTLTIPSSVTYIHNEAFSSTLEDTAIIEIYNLSSVTISLDDIIIHTSSSDESVIVKDDNFIYAYDGSVYYLVRYIGDGELELPSSFNYKGTLVTSYEIYRYFTLDFLLGGVNGSSARRSHSDTTEKELLVIPNSVTVIGDYAFYSMRYKRIEMADSVIKIGESAFYGGSIEVLTLSNNLQIIGRDAFENAKIKTINLPNSLISIGSSAFFDCDELTGITLPKSITTIGNSAFGFCKELSYVTYKGTMAEWTALNINVSQVFYSDHNMNVIICQDGSIVINR